MLNTDDVMLSLFLIGRLCVTKNIPAITILLCKDQLNPEEPGWVALYCIALMKRFFVIDSVLLKDCLHIAFLSRY